jgi:cysteinyl-tRNA synthetase
MKAFFFDVLGLLTPETIQKKSETSQLEGTLELLMELRAKARLNKDFESSDLIRDSLEKLKIQINDTAAGTTFKIN